MKRLNLKDSPVTEELAFYGKHPEYDGYGPQLRATYCRCQTEKVKGRMYIPLEEAYQHIKDCKKCQETMRLHIEMIKSPE